MGLFHRVVDSQGDHTSGLLHRAEAESHPHKPGPGADSGAEVDTPTTDISEKKKR
jgi:hypothetical protein